jgi:hypothetical protein
MPGSGLNESEPWALAVLSDLLHAGVEAADVSSSPSSRSLPLRRRSR